MTDLHDMMGFEPLWKPQTSERNQREFRPASPMIQAPSNPPSFASMLQQLQGSGVVRGPQAESDPSGSLFMVGE